MHPTKTDNWLPLTENETMTMEGMQARCTVPPTSPWFSGHFPGFPLLPGIAQLYMAFRAVQETETGRGRDVSLVGFKRIRFRRIISPGEMIDLSVARDTREENRYTFNVTVGGETAASGTIIIKENN